jgi:VWFA-related protein
MRRFGRVAFLFLFATSAAYAQVRETIDVHLVEVPVTVVDRLGNPVRGLTAANFEVLDRGARQTISNFDAIDLASESSRTLSPLNPAARRNWVLLFDLSFSSPIGRKKSQEAARNFIARGMGRRDLAAVATIDVDRGLRIITSLTTDRNLLAAAIANLHTFVSADPLRIASTTATESSSNDQSMQAQAAAESDDPRAEGNPDIARGDRIQNDEYNRARVERELQHLADLGRTLRVLPGRKQVILFSEGFDPRLVRGRDARASTEEQADLQQSISGNIWRIDSIARYGSSMTQTLLEAMAKSLRDSDVVLNAVDIQGVRTQVDQNGARINSNDALFLLSIPTGGTVFKNSNDVNADLAKILRSQEIVYVLGFRSPASNDGKFRELKVRLVNVPGGARVSHRAGYYASVQENALERSLTNAEIVLNDINQSDIQVSTLAAPFPAKSGNAHVPMVIDIGAEGLVAGEKKKEIAAEIYVYAFDAEGIVRDRSFQRLTIDSAKLAGHNGIKYFPTLSLPPGKYALKTLVRVAGTERKGYVRTDIEVPASYDVALLPPMFLDDPAAWVVVRGSTHDQSLPYPFHINGEPFMPSASAQVTNGRSRRVALFVFNVEPDELTWDTAVTDTVGSHAGAPSQVRRLMGHDVMKLVFDYAPADLHSGPASFDVTVHKKGSVDARTSSVSLMVR